ncbi:MAG: acyl-CoA thioester hydrolase/BAAT C-terminal domain-containing protein [Anaerolineae bacterium]
MADAASAIDYLLTRDDINPDQIGLLGHPLCGLVAAMLGASDPDLDFIISMAGPGVSGRDAAGAEPLPEAEGATQEQIDAQVAFVDSCLVVLDDPTAMENVT